MREAAAVEAARRSIDQAEQGRQRVHRRIAMGIAVAALMAGFPRLDLAQVWAVVVWLISGGGALMEFRRQSIAARNAEEIEVVLSLIEDWRRQLENEIAWRSGRIKKRPQALSVNDPMSLEEHPIYRRIMNSLS